MCAPGRGQRAGSGGWRRRARHFAWPRVAQTLRARWWRRGRQSRGHARMPAERARPPPRRRSATRRPRPTPPRRPSPRAVLRRARARRRRCARGRTSDSAQPCGGLRTVERSHSFGLVHTADDGPARAAARPAATAAEEALDAVGAWRIAAVAEAERAQQAFARGLETVYHDATTARVAFEQLAAKRSVEHAAATLQNQPAALGPARTSVNPEPGQSQAQLTQAVSLGVEAAPAQARARGASATRGEGPFDPGPALTRAELDRAMARDGALRAELRALPSRAELERRLGLAVDRLSPRALAILKYRVTAPQFAIALRLRRTLRDLAIGREEERDQ